MTNIFLVGDTHFGHKNILNYEAVARPFATIEEHDNEIVRRWNATVGPRDYVIHCGDVAMGRPGLRRVAELNGTKALMRGNHDIFRPAEYYGAGFTKLLPQPFDLGKKRGRLTRFCVTHAPIHPMCLAGRWVLNIHGHTHSACAKRRVRIGNDTYSWTSDARYYNVSLEQHELTPTPLEEIMEWAEEMGLWDAP